jgi:hypothetical protein
VDDSVQFYWDIIGAGKLAQSAMLQVGSIEIKND